MSLDYSPSNKIKVGCSVAAVSHLINYILAAADT